MFRNKFNRLLIVLFASIPSIILSQDTLNAYKISYYNNKVTKYLDKEKTLSGFYTVDKNGIKIYASAKDKQAGKLEFKVNWNKVDDLKLLFKSCSSNHIKETYAKGDYDKAIPCVPDMKLFVGSSLKKKKLSGYRIAIDAGHTADNMEGAKMESRHICFEKGCIKDVTDSIEFAEGILTFAAAQLLKEKLEEDGAEVFMTRKTLNSTAFGKSYDEWLKNDFKKYIDSIFKIGEIKSDKRNWYLTKATKQDKFRLIFRDLELQKRAEVVNNYHPDFTIIIHYNVDETNTGWTKPGKKDFDMAFVGGALYRSDLSTSHKRMEFLRLLVTDDLESSISLSSSVVKSFEKELQVKTATQKDAKYLRESCITANDNGVYCRNLFLTHYVHSPLVYGETLYQDNINECKMLNKETDKTKNERVKQVADAYYKGILNYVDTNSK
jgi:N-acetylmuramoyl-L-alanine amidase